MTVTQPRVAPVSLGSAAWLAITARITRQLNKEEGRSSKHVNSAQYALPVRVEDV
jgi:hypothetical protein